MTSSSLQLTLSTLKTRLNEQNEIVIQKEHGYQAVAEFAFHSPVSMEQVTDFKQQTGWILPLDYLEFLQIHNGLIINEKKFGDQNWLLSIEEIMNEYQDYMPEHWYPIFCVEGNYLLIDSELAQSGEDGYLFWFKAGETIEDAQNLPYNFATWFDRFIISQCSWFWEW